MAAISSIFTAFVDGQLDLFWSHAVLLGGAILAEALVAIGIWLESPKSKELRRYRLFGQVPGRIS
jgi:hypothetical protein